MSGKPKADGDEQQQPDRPNKKRNRNMFIEDAAEESGDEGDDDDEDEDGSDQDDYLVDGFVVNETEIQKEKDDLEDSDEDGSDDDDEGSTERRRLKKVRKVQERLDDEDMALIQEAQARERGDEILPKAVVAKTAEELRKGLFVDSDEEEDGKERVQQQQPVKKKPARVDRYDEDGMDDFIEDDIGDQDAIMAADRRDYDENEANEINEAQLNEASEIFGTDYLDFMQEPEPDDEEMELVGKAKYRERGVGVQYGDSDEEIVSDDDDMDDDDLFGDDDDDGGLSNDQKAESLRLKREKRKLMKEEKRAKALSKRTERRKAQLRRAFEPVQLIENFCTDRDDQIRQADVPERMFDWKTPFYGSNDDEMNESEREQAAWIAEQISAIGTEYFVASSDQQTAILRSIAFALKFMHRDKLEPAFIKRYRKDYVASSVVREHLYEIMDQDTEWDRIMSAKNRVDALVVEVQGVSQADESTGANAEKLVQMQDDLAAAKAKLDDTADQEAGLKVEIGALPTDDDSDDDDDNLFGESVDHAESQKKKGRLTAHLKTLQDLLQVQAEKVASLEAQLRSAEAQSRALNDPVPMERVQRKTCRDALWNSRDYLQYLSEMTDMRQILDLNGYMNLVKEGNDAIRKKELPLLSQDNKHDRRSRRFDRDFYRTCVAEGLRAVAYRFLLSPNRAGIKLEDVVTMGRFDFTKTMPGEESEIGAGDPLKWVPPVVSLNSPLEFASELVGSGELVVLQGESLGGDTSDPLRNCRYVAAMELAHEPRIRRHLRNIYRRHALLTTKPSKKGMDNIDAFHDYYGVHLIRSKPVSEHFTVNKDDAESRTAHLSEPERKEFFREMRKRERDSCLQYLHILKAEQTSDISVFVHLPIAAGDEDTGKLSWFDPQNKMFEKRAKQDISCLLSELKKVYLPPDGDTDEWNEERLKVLRLALTKFLLPQFETEIRRDLMIAAGTHGAKAASESLREVAMQGPYRPMALLRSENRHLVPTGDLAFVGVCVAHEGGRDATYLASVTERGESTDYLAVPAGQRLDAGKMREKVIMFLLQQRPSAVIIGTSGGFASRALHRQMSEIIREALEKWKSRDIQGDDEDDETFEARQSLLRQMQPLGHYDDGEEEDWTCNAELVDDGVSQLFGRSVRGKKEFADYPVGLRCAISIARFAKDPLAEYTYAFSSASETGVFGTEMLFLNIHPMQQLMPRTKLLKYYENTLCEVVADVGVDLNIAVSLDHLRGLLMFVSGLGPRKALMLKQSFSQIGGAVAKRRDLLEKRLLGPIVYNNAVAFLRIRETDQLVDQTLHPLDDTRLHPDVYLRNNWAVKVAFDALERDDARPKEAAATKALRDIMENSRKELKRLFLATQDEWEKHYGPTFNVITWNARDIPVDMWRDKVEELDLSAFADMIEATGHGKWHSHLEMIKWEFRLPFADPRPPMEPLKGMKLFQLITGETDQSLRPGKEVTGKVVRNDDFGSRIKLEGDIPAFIPLRNLSDEHVEAAEDFVAAGQIVTATVIEVKKDHMNVDLSLRMEDFRRKPSSWDRPEGFAPLDDHFDRTAAMKIEEDNSKAREARLETLMLSLGLKTDEDGNKDLKKKRIGRVVRRACTHPAFRNATQTEVEAELKAAGASMVGEAIIRPSSKNSDSLAIHWVVREGMIRVDEVEELEKDNEASIGNVLKVKNETYGSIDELLGRYVAPMNDLVEDLINHRKFLDKNEEEVDEELMDMKRSSPKSIPYAFYWLDPQLYPGYAALRFVGSVTPRGHVVGITPKGFSLGTNTFSSLDRLIGEFKKNPQGTVKPKEKPVGKPPPPKPAAKNRWGPSQSAPPQDWQQQPRPPPPQHAYPPQQHYSSQPYPPQQPPPPQYAYAQQQYPGYPPPPAYAQPPPQHPGYNQPYYPPPPAYGHNYPPQHQQPPPPQQQQQQQQRPPPPAAGGPPPRPPPPQQQPPPPAFDVPDGGAAQGRGRGRTLPAWMAQQQK